MSASTQAVAVLVLLLGLAPANPPAALWDGQQPLAGVWEGTRTVSEASDCRLANGPGARAPVKLTVRVAPNGQLIGELVFVDAPADAPQSWRGTEDRTRVRFEAAQTATCDGKKHSYAVTFSGKLPVRAKNGRNGLRLKAVDGLCGCAFDVHYDLTWTAPEPAAR